MKYIQPCYYLLYIIIAHNFFVKSLCNGIRLYVYLLLLFSRSLNHLFSFIKAIELYIHNYIYVHTRVQRSSLVGIYVFLSYQFRINEQVPKYSPNNENFKKIPINCVAIEKSTSMNNLTKTFLWCNSTFSRRKKIGKYFLLNMSISY